MKKKLGHMGDRTRVACVTIQRANHLVIWITASRFQMQISRDWLFRFSNKLHIWFLQKSLYSIQKQKYLKRKVEKLRFLNSLPVATGSIDDTRKGDSAKL